MSIVQAIFTNVMKNLASSENPYMGSFDALC